MLCFLDITEAKLNIAFCPLGELSLDVIKVMLLEMLEKVQNVEKLTFGELFLQRLSLLVAARRVTLPGIKVKDLKLETTISPFVMFGINRLLQYSPELKKLTAHVMESGTVPLPMGISNIAYGKVQPKNVNYFMEQMLKSTKTLEKMVVRLACSMDERGFEELLHQMVPVLSHKHNVSIVVSSTKTDPFQPGASGYEMGNTTSHTTRGLRLIKPSGKGGRQIKLSQKQLEMQRTMVRGRGKPRGSS